MKKSTLFICTKYIRAYTIIFSITFCELTVGLLLVRPKYALISALFISALDILPVFGAGLILIPWGIICLISGEIWAGIGLILLYVTVTVVRQLIEPRIVGESIGLHPLGVLLCMYVGNKIFGLFGMLCAPMALSVILSIVHTRKDLETKNG